MQTFTTEQIQVFFHQHFTVRKYKNFQIPEDHIQTLYTAAQRAPTDATAQMYSFIRLKDEVLRKKIADLTTNAHFATASLSFLICADVFRLEEILKTHGFEPGIFPSVAVHFAIGDAVMAAQNMLIAAEMLGYKGCWIGGVLNGLEEICHLTQLPKGVFPFAGLTVGVPDEPAISRPRLPLNQIVHEDYYRSYSEDELKNGAEAMAAITGRGNWPQTLARYFSKDGAMEKREPVLNNLLNSQIKGRKG